MEPTSSPEPGWGKRVVAQMLRKKDMATVVGALRHNELYRTLDLTALVCMGVGAVVGAGVFVITGQAAALYAGPALSLSFLLCILPCLFTGLCYAELSAMVPVAGSAYTHASLALGELAAYTVAVCLTLENLVSGSAVAVSWSASVCALLREWGVQFPEWLAHSPVVVENSRFVASGALLNVPAVFICVVVTVVLCVGIQESASVNTAFVFIKLGVLCCFVGYGLYYAIGHWDVFCGNLTPFIPPNDGTFGHFGVSGIFRGAGVVFFANVGFDTICATAQECKQPQRDLPRSLVLTLCICTACYCAVTVALTGMMKYDQLNVDDPVIEALVHVRAPFALRVLVDVGAIAGLTSVCLMAFLAMPRLLLTLAKDGLISPALSRVHPRWHTPVAATISSGVVGAVVAGVFPLDMLGELISFGTLVAFTGVCVSMWRLRHTAADVPRPFQAPLFPLTPALGILFNTVQLFALPLSTWRNYAVVLVIALAWYFLYSRHHSTLQEGDAAPPVSDAATLAHVGAADAELGSKSGGEDAASVCLGVMGMADEEIRVADIVGQEELPVRVSHP
ncbi:Amino acid permease/C-terminus of AA permease [Novymonas esmeraldas]|uniref:Amino acid permease/C-terminus of AA permease n=1 Tax=Novymonas esmeraldas TaxID=1808958 RepID=A0AAW0EMH5_9TRYP